VDIVPPDISLPEALKTALENRPELQQSNIGREINQVDQKYFREQTKPAVDLVGTYGMIGLAGTSSGGANPFTASHRASQRINKLLLNAVLISYPIHRCKRFHLFCSAATTSRCKNLLSNRFNNFRVGVQVNLPLRNRTAAGAVWGVHWLRDRRLRRSANNLSSRFR